MKFQYLKCRPIHPFPIVAWLIMLFQGEWPWKPESTSHRALAFLIDGDWLVIDSVGQDGVRIQPKEKFCKQYLIKGMEVFSRDINYIDIEAWVCDIDTLLYDRWQIVGLALKSLGLISFNHFGENYTKLTCNEVFVNFCETFLNYKVGDSDNYDLRSTDALAKRVASGEV